MLVLSLIFGWKSRHVDVKYAYLNGKLKEEIYMKLETDSNKKRIVKLQRPIYGLKQSGHNWNDALDGFLTKLGLIRLSTSNCISHLDYHAFVIIYVDDILIFSQEEKTLDEIAEKIGKEYEIRDLGKLSYFLGISVHQTEHEICLSQQAYVRSLIEEYGLQDCRPSHTPLEPGIKLSKEDCPVTDEERNAMKNVPYRQLIGSLMYIAQNTRSDIRYAVEKLAQVSSNLEKVHWTEAKRVLRYLSDTSEFSLTYKRAVPIVEL